MDWDDVRVFLAVARTGKLLSAARALGLNHATVARRLSNLEQALGSKLVTRTTSGCVLTAEGERLLKHAERVESVMLGATQAVGSQNTSLEGTVRIGAPDGFGSGFLALHIGELLQRYPDLKVELVPLPRMFSLSRREADLAVTLERPREGRLVARKLCDYRLKLYASKAYLKKHRSPKSLDELRSHRLIGYVEDLTFTTSLAYTGEFLKDWDSQLSIATAVGQTAAVRAGCGIGILHTFIARNEPGLVPVLPEHFVTRSYWTVLHEDLRATKRIAVVADFLKEIVAREISAFG